MSEPPLPPPPPPPPSAVPGPPPGAERPGRPTLATVAGIGLIGGGVIQFVASGAGIGASIYDMARGGPLTGVAVFTMLGVLAGLLTALGGIQLLRGQTRRLVYAGAIAAMVPGTLCCVPGLGFGIFTLVILPRPELRTYFGLPVPPTAPPPPATLPPAAGEAPDTVGR